MSKKKNVQTAKAPIDKKSALQSINWKAAILKKELLIILSIFLFTFFIRVLYLEQMKSNPFFSYPIIDAGAYDENALNMALGMPTSDHKQTFFQAPCYIFFLAGMYKVFGHNYYIVRIVQIIISSLSCVLLFFIARKLFNQTTALIAAAIYALYGTIIFYDCEMLNPVLLIFFNLLGLLLLIYATEKQKLYLWLLCGLAFGLSIITRENTLLFIPIVVLWIFFVFRKQAPVKRILIYLLSFISAVIIVVAPVTIRNYLVEKDLVIVSHTGGLNFFIGNMGKTDFYLTLQPGYHWIQLLSMPEGAAGRYLKSSARSGWFFNATFRFIFTHPVAWIKIFIKKFTLFWNGYEFDPNYDIHYVKKYSPILRIALCKFAGIYFPFGIIVPFALLGVILALKNKDTFNQPNLFLLLAYAGVFSLSVILFLIKARYRLPVIPLFILFAAHGMYRLFTMVKKSTFSLAAGSSVLLLCLFTVLCNFQFYKINSKDYFPLHYYLARTHVKRKNYDAAIAEYELALKEHNNQIDVYTELANTYIDQGKIFKAYVACKKALLISPNHHAALEIMKFITRKLKPLLDDFNRKKVNSIQRSTDSQKHNYKKDGK